MKIVIIKHVGDGAHYMFSVRSDMNLKEGDVVLVNNRKGETNGICVCDSFSVAESPLKALAARYGAKLPLSPVIGLYHLMRFGEDA